MSKGRNRVEWGREARGREPMARVQKCKSAYGLWKSAKVDAGRDSTACCPRGALGWHAVPTLPNAVEGQHAVLPLPEAK